MAGKFKKEFSEALASVECFYYSDNKDLGHFVTLLKNSVKDPGFQVAADNLLKALSSAIISNGVTGSNDDPGQDPEYPDPDDDWRSPVYASGLAIYFPIDSSDFHEEYFNLPFAQNSRWDEMVQDFYKKHTFETVLREAQDGNLSTLREYVKKASLKNRDTSSFLTTQLLFSLFSEKGVPEPVRHEVTNLLKELKSKE
jgi:hypothetical protein